MNPGYALVRCLIRANFLYLDVTGGRSKIIMEHRTGTNGVRVPREQEKVCKISFGESCFYQVKSGFNKGVPAPLDLNAVTYERRMERLAKRGERSDFHLAVDMYETCNAELFQALQQMLQQFRRMV